MFTGFDRESNDDVARGDLGSPGSVGGTLTARDSESHAMVDTLARPVDAAATARIAASHAAMPAWPPRYTRVLAGGSDPSHRLRTRRIRPASARATWRALLM